MRVLAIDPAIRNTGYAVAEIGADNIIKALEFGCISIPVKHKSSVALHQIYEHICQLIEKWQINEIAIEGIIFVQSFKTAISMGSSRGPALIAGAKYELDIYEYSPKEVKKSVTGKGNANKDQVAFMARLLYKLEETPQSDAADALAIAHAHLSRQDPLKQSILKPRLI